jgi:hypothetical protein
MEEGVMFGVLVASLVYSGTLWILGIMALAGVVFAGFETTPMSVIAGVLPHAPSSVDIPIPITDPVILPDLQLQAEPIDIPMPTSDPFIG